MLLVQIRKSNRVLVAFVLTFVLIFEVFFTNVVSQTFSKNHRTKSDINIIRIGIQFVAESSRGLDSRVDSAANESPNNRVCTSFVLACLENLVQLTSPWALNSLRSFTGSRSMCEVGLVGASVDSPERRAKVDEFDVACVVDAYIGGKEISV